MVIVEWDAMTDVDGYETKVETEEELVPKKIGNNQINVGVLTLTLNCLKITTGTSKK